MEYFGITLYGPQNYIKDMLQENYLEPTCKDEAETLIHTIAASNKKMIEDFEEIRLIDCYIGRVNGFAYGSMQRFIKMKRKGVIKPIGPGLMYRLPPATSIEYGWWQYDPALTNQNWYITVPRRPQPSSPNTLILDKVRKNNKYATLF